MEKYSTVIMRNAVIEHIDYLYNHLTDGQVAMLYRMVANTIPDVKECDRFWVYDTFTDDQRTDLLNLMARTVISNGVDLDLDRPSPMFPDTTRGGVIGYMCQIDFECELGSTSAVVRPTASQALCTGTCGVVEVEVIGRRVIAEETWDDHEMGDEELEKVVDGVKLKLEAVDEGKS